MRSHSRVLNRHGARWMLPRHRSAWWHPCLHIATTCLHSAMRRLPVPISRTMVRRMAMSTVLHPRTLHLRGCHSMLVLLCPRCHSLLLLRHLTSPRALRHPAPPASYWYLPPAPLHVHLPRRSCSHLTRSSRLSWNWSPPLHSSCMRAVRSTSCHFLACTSRHSLTNLPGMRHSLLPCNSMMAASPSSSMLAWMPLADLRSLLGSLGSFSPNELLRSQLRYCLHTKLLQRMHDHVTMRLVRLHSWHCFALLLRPS
jgi:hypothetical protein